jgi:hypothetical protein
MTTSEIASYPVRLEVDYPDRPLNRLTTLVRIVWALPVVVILELLGSVTTAPVALSLLFRRKYPRWWFDWNVELSRFSTRAWAYLLLLRDEYPSLDAEQAVHLEIDFPNAEQDLRRWMPLVKWLLAIPHYVVFLLLLVVVVVVVTVAWFAILFTGRYPRVLFNLVVGTMRWGARVGGYVALLVTDRYPPFSLE